MTIKTRTEARIWLYRDAVAASLRKHLHDTHFLPKGLTPAQLKRVQLEMERLAAQLEAKAARLAAKQSEDPDYRHIPAREQSEAESHAAHEF